MRNFQHHLIRWGHTGLEYIKSSPWIILTLLLAAPLYLLVIVPSGSHYCFGDECGWYFWGAHEHDGIWHIALIETAFRSWPFRMPVYAGLTLANYNYLFDLILALVSQIGVTSFTLYFKIQPILWFGVFSVVLIDLAHRIYDEFVPVKKARQLFVWIQVACVYFLTSFGFMFTLLHEGTITGSASLMPMQGPLGMTNPQFMWSLICIMLLISMTMRYIKSQTIRWYIPALGLAAFVAVSLKAYAIVNVVLIVSGGGIWLATRKKPITAYLGVTLLSIALAYLIFYAGGKGGFIYAPFELVRSIYGDTHFLPNDDVMQRWFLLTSSDRWSPQLLSLQLRAALIYLATTFGVRIGIFFVAGLLTVRLMAKQRLSQIHLLILIVSGGSLISALPSLLLIQKGIWWNSVQFLYYAIFLASFPTAWCLFELTHRHRRTGILVVSLALLLSLPSHIDTVSTFLPVKPTSHITVGQAQALQALRRLPDGVVYAPLYDPEIHKSIPSSYGASIPYHADTAYVSAFSGKPVYYANEIQLQLLNVDYTPRKKQMTAVDCEVFDDVMYVFLLATEVRKDRYTHCLDVARFRQIYANDAAEIWSKPTFKDIK